MLSYYDKNFIYRLVINIYSDRYTKTFERGANFILKANRSDFAWIPEKNGRTDIVTYGFKKKHDWAYMQLLYDCITMPEIKR